MKRNTKRSGDANVAIAYLRASTEDQRLSPEAQRASIEAWALAQGVVVVAWHVDAGVSGAADLSDRPALVAALAELRLHRAGIFVVAKRDRLARDCYVAIARPLCVGLHAPLYNRRRERASTLRGQHTNGCWPPPVVGHPSRGGSASGLSGCGKARRGAARCGVWNAQERRGTRDTGTAFRQFRDPLRAHTRESSSGFVSPSRDLRPGGRPRRRGWLWPQALGCSP